MDVHTYVCTYEYMRQSNQEQLPKVGAIRKHISTLNHYTRPDALSIERPKEWSDSLQSTVNHRLKHPLTDKMTALKWASLQLSCGLSRYHPSATSATFTGSAAPKISSQTLATSAWPPQEGNGGSDYLKGQHSNSCSSISKHSLKQITPSMCWQRVCHPEPCNVYNKH